MKITYQGIEVIIQGKDKHDEFFSDASACSFLNRMITAIYRAADEAESRNRKVIADLYRAEASDLFDQIALTGFYGPEHQKKAEQKRGDN